MLKDLVHQGQWRQHRGHERQHQRRQHGCILVQCHRALCPAGREGDETRGGFSWERIYWRNPSQCCVNFGIQWLVLKGWKGHFVVRGPTGFSSETVCYFDFQISFELELTLVVMAMNHMNRCFPEHESDGLDLVVCPRQPEHSRFSMHDGTSTSRNYYY